MSDSDNITLPREVVKLALEALAKTPCNSVYEQDCTPCNAEEALRTALVAPKQEPSEDVEALRRDAERYRWLRDNAAGFSGKTLDAAIDAAMKEGA